MLTRREAMSGEAAIAGCTAAGAIAIGRTAAEPREVIAKPVAHGVKSIALDLAERPTALPCFNGKVLPLWTFLSGTTFPIVRVNLGERLNTLFKNRLPRDGEVASIHWHGLRVPNTQDGVPYLTQQPIAPG